MSKLRAPLKRWLDTSLSEQQLQFMWRELQRGQVGRQARDRRAVWVMASAAALLMAAVGLRIFVSSPRAASGPLTVRGRAALVPAETLGGATPRQLDLDDGSQIALDASARMSVLENSAQRVVLHLQRGRSRFEVRPGGTRRWSIECGLATVEVVGTRFAIDRSAGAVRVQVSRGIVLVRGEGVPDRVRRLVAGETLEVHEPASGPGAIQTPADGTRGESADSERAREPGAPIPLDSASQRRAHAADGGGTRAAELREPGAATGAADGPPAAARLAVDREKSAGGSASSEGGAIDEVAPGASPLAVDRAKSGDRGSARREGGVADGVGLGASRIGTDRERSRVRGTARREGVVDGVAPGASRLAVERENRGPALARREGGPVDGVVAVGRSRLTPDRAWSDGRGSREARGPAVSADDEAALLALLRAADRARSDGREARAAALLRRVMQRAPGSAYEALAAFSLARMQLEHAPAEAARNLRRALEADTPHSLKEDALASLVEAYARSRQSALAREAADAYEAAFPSGGRSAEVRFWAAPQ